MKKIKDLFPLVNGLFSYIDYTLEEPFDLSSAQLDLLFISHYGMRHPAPIITVLQSETGDYESYLNAEQLQVLSSIILKTYKHKWDKLFEIAKIEYMPIYNYYDNLEEAKTNNINDISLNTETQNLSTQRTDNLSEQRTDNLSEQRTDNLSEQRTDNLTAQLTENLATLETDNYQIAQNGNTETDLDSTTTNGVQGFNSDTYKGATNSIVDSTTSESKEMTETHTGTRNAANTGTETTTNTGTQTTQNTGTQTTQNTGTQTTLNTGTRTTLNTGTDTHSLEKDIQEESTRAYTKYGNIGNIATQDLIRKEIELWQYNFIDTILKDVSSFLTIPIY